MLGDDFVFEAILPPVAFQLNEETLPQIARAHARWIKTPNQGQHSLKILLWDAGIERHLFRRALEKAVVVDVANDQFRGLAVSGIERRLIQLSDQILLQRFLGGDGIKKELASIFRVLRTSAVAARLRHVIAPFLVKGRKLIELLFKIIVRGRFRAVSLFRT